MDRPLAVIATVTLGVGISLGFFSLLPKYAVFMLLMSVVRTTFWVLMIFGILPMKVQGNLLHFVGSEGKLLTLI
jgi:hypothetical protein